MATQLLRLLVMAATGLAWSGAGAGETPDPGFDRPVPLPDDELRQITVSLLEGYPELASSPGAKVAAAYLGSPGARDTATVIYYPHAEHRGIKAAFQVRCVRGDSSNAWTCNEVAIRRYLQLASQAFEVRVVADISIDVAFAVIEASRRDLHAAAADAFDLPNTAIIITSYDDGRYFINWGSPEGFSEVTMLAQLADSADPTSAESWRASIFEPPPLE